MISWARFKVFVSDTLGGRYDSDDGGRQAPVREEIRREIHRVVMNLESLEALIGQERSPGYSVITFEDAMVLTHVGTRIAQLGSGTVLVRRTQSPNGRPVKA